MYFIILRSTEFDEVVLFDKSDHSCKDAFSPKHNRDRSEGEREKTMRPKRKTMQNDSIASKIAIHKKKLDIFSPICSP